MTELEQGSSSRIDWKVVDWMRKRHHRLAWGVFRRRFLPGWQIRDGRTAMFRPWEVEVTRYRFRGYDIATPWSWREPETTTATRA